MKLRNIILPLCLLLSLTVWSKESTAILQSRDGDKITVRYDVSVNADGAAGISVLNVKKQLGFDNGDKFRDSERVKVLFFDKSGGHSADKFKSDIATEALLIPSDEISYTRSADGFVWLDELPQLKLRLLSSNSSLSIPVFLAYYEKKHTYKVFASCGYLNIPLSLPANADGNVSPAMVKRKRTLTETEEIEEDSELTDKEIALLLIDRIQSLLTESKEGSVPEGIDAYAAQLRQLELTIPDRDIKVKIADTFAKIEERKTEAASSASLLRQQEEADAAARTEETEARRNIEYLNERLDNFSDLSDDDVAELKSVANELRRKSHSVSDEALASEMKAAADRCDEEVKKLDDSKKRRNVWMIIGGVIMAILMFVGNHFFQHFRNISNQKGIEEMQTRIMKQAENDAKRRARGLAHNHMAMARNKARGKVNKSVDKGISKITKGKGNKVTI